jgi:hypothetical protein
MSSNFLSFREREREREEKRKLWIVVRETTLEDGVKKTIFVSRQCPLVLLLGVKHMIRINYKFNFYGVRGAAFE